MQKETKATSELPSSFMMKQSQRKELSKLNLLTKPLWLLTAIIDFGSEMTCP